MAGLFSDSYLLLILVKFCFSKRTHLLWIGKLVEIVLKFSESDFHHLAGLHKLKDLHIARANRGAVFQQILHHNITYNTLTKVSFFLKSKIGSIYFPTLKHCWIAIISYFDIIKISIHIPPLKVNFY